MGGRPAEERDDHQGRDSGGPGRDGFGGVFEDGEGKIFFLLVVYLQIVSVSMLVYVRESLPREI